MMFVNPLTSVHRQISTSHFEALWSADINSELFLAHHEAVVTTTNPPPPPCVHAHLPHRVVSVIRICLQDPPWTRYFIHNFLSRLCEGSARQIAAVKPGYHEGWKVDDKASGNQHAQHLEDRSQSSSFDSAAYSLWDHGYHWAPLNCSFITCRLGTAIPTLQGGWDNSARCR